MEVFDSLTVIDFEVLRQRLLKDDRLLMLQCCLKQSSSLYFAETAVILQRNLWRKYQVLTFKPT